MLLTKKPIHFTANSPIWSFNQSNEMINFQWISFLEISLSHFFFSFFFLIHKSNDAGNKFCAQKLKLNYIHNPHL